MANIFVRASGTAANYAAAVGGSLSNVSECLDMAGFNTEQTAGAFQAGDVVQFSDMDGNYTTGCVIKQGGTSGNIITYKNVDTESPSIVLGSGVAWSMGTATISIDYFRLEGMTGKTEGATCFVLDKDSGSDGSGFTAHIKSCTCTGSNAGDAFGQASAGATTASGIWEDCDATDVGVTTTSQAFTAHANQTMQIIGGTITNCNEVFSIVGTTVCTSTGMTIISNNATAKVVSNVDVTATLTVTGATMTLSGSNQTLWNLAAVGTTLNWIDCNVTLTDHGSEKFIRGALNISGGTYDLNDAAIRYQVLNGGIATIEDAAFIVGALNANIIRTSAGGGSLNVRRSTFDCSGMSGDFCFRVSSTAGSSDVEIISNVFKDFTSASACWDFASGCTANIDCSNNTFVNGAQGVDPNTGPASTTININNNIFKDVTTSIGGALTNVDVDNNCYFNSSDEGGTGSITDDPEFISGSDFHLQEGSPCIGTGKVWWSGATPTDNDGNTFNTPPEMGAFIFSSGGPLDGRLSIKIGIGI